MGLNYTGFESFFTQPILYVPWFWSAIMLLIFVVIFAGLKAYATEKALITSSLLTFLISSSFWAVQLVPPELPIGMLIIFAFSFIFMKDM